MRATPEPPRLPTKGRQIGRQCQRRGSGPVVLVGVTPHQGDRESRPQGEGVYRPTVPRTTVTGSNMLHHGAICDQRHYGNGTFAHTGSSESGYALSTTLGEDHHRRMAEPSLGRDTAQQRKSDAGHRQDDRRRRRPAPYPPTRRAITAGHLPAESGTAHVHPKEQR